MVKELGAYQGLMEKTRHARAWARASRTRCARPRPSLFWKACTRTGASAAMKKPGSRPRRAAASRRRRTARRRRPKGSISEVRFAIRDTPATISASAPKICCKALSDFFLESGFDNPYMQFSELNQHTLEDLKRAIEQALEPARCSIPSAPSRSASSWRTCRGGARSVAESAGAEAGGRRLHHHRAAGAAARAKREGRRSK